jgi:hypothetical protein
MKKATLIIILILGICSVLHANPIPLIPAVKFSELVFNDSGKWTIELFYPIGYEYFTVDSLVIESPTARARLKTVNKKVGQIGVITSDSLSVPLIIRREGDRLELRTYSSSYGHQIIPDILIFGDIPGAFVGQPVSDYSIMINTWEDEGDNTLTIACLTKNPSLGTINETTGLSGTLTGYIYDSNDNLVTKLKEFPASPSYFLLHTPLFIDANGSYSTKIFRRFSVETFDHLDVKLVDFEGWLDTVAIQPFELENIHPDTTIVQDIHLKDDEYVVSGVKNHTLPQSAQIEFINYPNPFNSSTKFFIKVPEGCPKLNGHIYIHNSRGELVKDLALSGTGKTNWDGTSATGGMMPSGLYYYQLKIDNKVLKTGSMILLK